MDQPYDPAADGDQEDVETPEEVVEEPSEPQIVRIKVNGKVLMVPEDVADAIQAREDDFNRRLSQQGAELGRLRQQQQPQQPQTTPEDEDLAFFTSPSQALKRALAEERELRRQEDQLREAQRVYWNAFYKEHNHLVGRETVVESVLNQNLQYLATLSPAQSRKELGEYVTTLLTPTDQGTKKRLPQGQVVSERASNPPPTRRAAPKTDDDSYSGEDILRQRRERMRRAMYKMPKG